MSETIELRSSTQTIEVHADRSITVVNSGPPGPAGQFPPGGSPGEVVGKDVDNNLAWLQAGTSDEITTQIAEHDQASDSHTSKTSGRDFSAVFTNGLV